MWLNVKKVFIELLAVRRACWKVKYHFAEKYFNFGKIFEHFWKKVLREVKKLEQKIAFTAF